ncbi:MAG: hypothetical protein AABW85_05995 [archaeon]
MTLLVFAFAALLSVAHLFSGKVQKQIEKFHTKIISLSAGIFTAYIFLSMLPEFFKGTQLLGATAFQLLLAGFIVFHALEKYLYQHIKNKNELMTDLAELHIIGFFFDHFVTGIILFFALTTENIFIGSLIFLPLFLHTISSSMSLQHIYERFNKNMAMNALLSFSPLIGTIFAQTLNPTPALHYSIFSFIIGTLLYVVIRDTMPAGKKGNIELFIFGAITTAILILLTTEAQNTGLFFVSAL